MDIAKPQSGTDKKTVEVNGTKLHVLIDGPENAPWVVLIHSLGTNSALYDGQIPNLTQDFRVLRYDTRGHGRSPAPPGPYSLNILVDDLFGLFARFRISRAHVVGMSLGAMTVMAAAQRGAPQLASMVFCGARADLTPDFVKSVDDRNRVVRDQGMNSIARLMAAHWLMPATFNGKPDIAEKITEMVRTTSLDGYMACGEAIKSGRLMERLATVKVPSLFVAGDHDPEIPKEIMHRLQAMVPRSEFSILVGASHLSNLDQPHSFNKVVGDFLRKQA